MIIYEVNLQLDPSIENDYLDWLRDHIQQILTCEGFVNAYLSKVEGNNHAYTVQYCIKESIYLDDYLNNKALAMRKESMEKFGDLFSANRRVYSIIYEQKSTSG